MIGILTYHMRLYEGLTYNLPFVSRVRVYMCIGLCDYILLACTCVCPGIYTCVP